MANNQLVVQARRDVALAQKDLVLTRKDAEKKRDEPQHKAPQRKIGDQTVRAMGSLGLEELRNALYHGSTVAQHSTEPGMWGDRSYGDVADARGREDRSRLEEQVRQAELEQSQKEREPEVPEYSLE